MDPTITAQTPALLLRHSPRHVLDLYARALAHDTHLVVHTLHDGTPSADGLNTLLVFMDATAFVFRGHAKDAPYRAQIPSDQLPAPFERFGFAHDFGSQQTILSRALADLGSRLLHWTVPREDFDYVLAAYDCFRALLPRPLPEMAAAVAPRESIRPRHRRGA